MEAVWINKPYAYAEFLDQIWASDELQLPDQRDVLLLKLWRKLKITNICSLNHYKHNFCKMCSYELLCP